MGVLPISGLPHSPLDAAAAFHAEWLPRIRTLIGAADDTRNEHLVLIFPLADHCHRAWRLAAVQELARAHAPRRINALVSDSPPGQRAGQALLERCEGITGQVLVLDPLGVLSGDS